MTADAQAGRGPAAAADRIDAPARRAVAIGIATGRSGTDVAHEAADLLLADDNQSTVAAVTARRVPYASLHEAVRSYLAVKVGLIAATLLPVLLGLPIPFTPAQIISLELFMDLGASTTSVAGRPETDVRVRPPRRPDQPFVDGSLLFGVFGGGTTLAAAVLAACL